MDHFELYIIGLYLVSVFSSFAVFMKGAKKATTGKQMTTEDYVATSIIISCIPIINVLALLVAIFDKQEN